MNCQAWKSTKGEATKRAARPAILKYMMNGSVRPRKASRVPGGRNGLSGATRKA